VRAIPVAARLSRRSGVRFVQAINRLDPRLGKAELLADARAEGAFIFPGILEVSKRVARGTEDH